MRYFVYVHTNKKNGKKYVGITTRRPEDRWRNGYGYLEIRNGQYRQPKFARAIIKYGWDGFEHQYWEVYSKESMMFWESFLIDKYDSIKNGYNGTTGGEHPVLSEDGKKKLSDHNSGTGNPFWGKTHSLETRKILSDKLSGENHPNFGKHRSTDTKNKISIKNSKPILQYSLDMELIKEWPSIIDVAKEFGYSAGTIVNCLKGRRNKAYNFIWRYK